MRKQEVLELVEIVVAQHRLCDFDHDYAKQEKEFGFGVFIEL